MKYTQIFVCIIARGQIARDRAMGPYFIGNMAWRAFWGRGPERPTCVGVDHGISNEWQTIHFSGE